MELLTPNQLNTEKNTIEPITNRAFKIRAATPAHFSGYEKYQFLNTTSRCKEIKSFLAILPQVAKSHSTVLIDGEAGTGKKSLARAIHNLSHNKNEPFLEISCTPLKNNYFRPKHTTNQEKLLAGTIEDIYGLFITAGKGTIYFEEIGDTSLYFQRKLLQILESQTFHPLGYNEKTEQEARVIITTNGFPEKMLSAGKFRRDLFYKVNVIRVSLPPLRKRKKDIPLLIAFFIKDLNQSQGKSIQGFTKDALAVLKSYDYPGNIPELRSIIEYGHMFCFRKKINRSDLPSYLFRKKG